MRSTRRTISASDRARAVPPFESTSEDHSGSVEGLMLYSSPELFTMAPRPVISRLTEPARTRSWPAVTAMAAPEMVTVLAPGVRSTAVMVRFVATTVEGAVTRSTTSEPTQKRRASVTAMTFDAVALVTRTREMAPVPSP